LYNPNVRMRKRIFSAVVALIVNVIFWIIIPYYIGVFLVGKVPETPLIIPAFVYEFGVLFIILDVFAAFFQGKAIAVPFISGAALLSALYLWLITNGGALSVSTSGISLGLGFQLLVYVLILPSIWAAIRAPLSYFLWRRSILAQTAAGTSPA
jgi:hypothetical protein